MEKSGNFLKTDFIVTFFVDDKAISRTMSDVLKNKNNTLYRETLGLPADFTIPFSQDSIMARKAMIGLALTSYTGTRRDL